MDVLSAPLSSSPFSSPPPATVLVIHCTTVRPPLSLSVTVRSAEPFQDRGTVSTLTFTTICKWVSARLANVPRTGMFFLSVTMGIKRELWQLSSGEVSPFTVTERLTSTNGRGRGFNLRSWMLTKLVVFTSWRLLEVQLHCLTSLCLF